MPPHIPHEIYRCILQHFDRDLDKRALRTVAVSSILLRDESQRILFRTAFEETWNIDEDNHRRNRATLRRHQAFLEAIVDSPNRLGPLVRSYSQWKIAYNGGDDPKYSVALRCRVFELTSNAFQFMVNLKELRFSPYLATGFTPSSILRGCTFQLESLAWTPWVGNAEEQLFIESQKSLLHFDALDWTSRNSQPLCLSPNLKSIRGCAGDLCMLNLDRTIVAFDYWENQAPKYPQRMFNTTKALQTVQYLRVQSYYDYLQLIGDDPLWEALGMIELTLLRFENVVACTELPTSLCVLVVHVEDKYDLHQDREDEGKDPWVTKFLFSTFPALKYIDIYRQSTTRCITSWRYRREITDSGITSIEVSNMAYSRADSWWRNHVTELEHGNINRLEI